MKRHPALHDLSRDHHHLLLQCRQIRWHVAGDRRAPPLAEVVADFLELWHSETLLHLREEETLFLPFLRSHAPALWAEVEGPMHADHDWLRENVARLAETSTSDPAPLLAEIGARLHDHVRWEERTVFPRVQRALSDAALNEWGAASRAFRAAHRPHAIGPRG